MPSEDTNTDMSRREQSKLRTRQAIVVAAAQLVDARGLRAVTVADICTAADVSSRTFSNYFPSKSAAAIGLARGSLAAYEQAPFDGDRSTLLRDLCDVVADLAGSPLERAHIRRLLRHPDLQPALAAAILDIRVTLYTLAARRVDVDSANQAVAVVIAAIHIMIGDPGVDTQDDVRGALFDIVRSLGAFITTHTPALSNEGSL